MARLSSDMNDRQQNPLNNRHAFPKVSASVGAGSVGRGRQVRVSTLVREASRVAHSGFLSEPTAPAGPSRESHLKALANVEEVRKVVEDAAVKTNTFRALQGGEKNRRAMKENQASVIPPHLLTREPVPEETVENG